MGMPITKAGDSLWGLSGDEQKGRRVRGRLQELAKCFQRAIVCLLDLNKLDLWMEFGPRGS